MHQDDGHGANAAKSMMAGSATLEVTVRRSCVAVTEPPACRSMRLLPMAVPDANGAHVLLPAAMYSTT